MYRNVNKEEVLQYLKEGYLIYYVDYKEKLIYSINELNVPELFELLDELDESDVTRFYYNDTDPVKKRITNQK